MKKTLYLLPVIALSILASCYDGGYVLDDRTISELKVLPVEINDATKELSLKGDPGSMGFKNVHFQLSRTKDFSRQESMNIFYDNSWNIPIGWFGGTYYYRLCAALDGDTVYSPNIETFEINSTLSIPEVLAVNETSCVLTCTSNYQGNVSFRLSTDKDFNDYFDFKAYVESIESQSRYIASAENLKAGTTYYVKAIRDVYLGPLESDVISFKTVDYLRMGDVTYTGWDGKTHPMSDGYDHFLANYRVGASFVDFNIEVYNTGDVWRLAKYLKPTGSGVLYGFFSYDSPDSNGVVWLQTYKYDNPLLMWGVSEERNGVFDINFRNMLARVVLNITVSDDYPIDKPVVENFTIAGNTLPTIAGFDVNTGDWVFNQHSYSESLGYWRKVGLCKGETVEVVLYSIPCEKGMATATFNFWQNKYQSDIEIGWEAGKTYEYNVNVNTAGLSISDVKLKDWVPNEVGSIIINP